MSCPRRAQALKGSQCRNIAQDVGIALPREIAFELGKAALAIDWVDEDGVKRRIIQAVDKDFRQTEELRIEFGRIVTGRHVKLDQKMAIARWKRPEQRPAMLGSPAFDEPFVRKFEPMFGLLAIGECRLEAARARSC